MANIFDRFLNSMKLYDDDDEEFDEDEEIEEEPVRPSLPKPSFRRNTRRDEEESAPAPAATPAPQPAFTSKPAHRANRDNVVTVKSRSSMEVCMVCPRTLEDAREICDILLSNRAVVINLEGVDVEIAQRIIDFTSGACFSIRGNLQKISKFIFIVSPEAISLTGDFADKMEDQDFSRLEMDR